MAKTKEYRVVMAESLHLLELEVNKELARGWELQGGVSIGRVKSPTEESEKDYFSHDCTFLQAMVRDKP